MGRASKNYKWYNVLINWELRCIHHKKYDDSVREIKTLKKLLLDESLYMYELGLTITFTIKW